jgi:hypothetical protein
VRPRILIDQVWKKDAPSNAIRWAVKDMTQLENDNTDHNEPFGTQDLNGNCNIFLFFRI